MYCRIFYSGCTTINHAKIPKNVPKHSHWSTIRTRLKASIFGVFAFVVLKRRQPYFVLRTQNRSKIRGFEVEEF